MVEFVAGAAWLVWRGWRARVFGRTVDVDVDGMGMGEERVKRRMFWQGARVRVGV